MLSSVQLPVRCRVACATTRALPCCRCLVCDYPRALPCCRRKQVLLTHADAARDGVRVPITVSDYCTTARPQHASDSVADMADFYDDDYMDDDDSDDAADDDEVYDDDDDSGNGES